MLKPIRWKTFPLDFLRIQLGFLLFGLAIALMIRGNIGTSAWVVLEAALAYRFGITVGTMTVIMGFIVLFSAAAMREKMGWGTLANILSIGPWVDLWNSFIPSVTDNLPLQIFMLLAAILLMGLGSAIYIGVDAGAGPRICIGASFALQEAVIILATLLARFRFTRVPGRDPRPVLILTLRPEGGVWLSVERD